MGQSKSKILANLINFDLESTKQPKEEALMYNNLPFLVKDWDNQ